MGRKLEPWDSWVASNIHWDEGRRQNWANLQPYGIIRLRSAMAETMERSELAIDHVRLLHSRLGAMAKEFGDCKVEVGLYERHDGKSRDNRIVEAWPYAGIATFRNGQLQHGIIVIPCALSFGRYYQHRLRLREGGSKFVRGPWLWNSLTPVFNTAAGGPRDNVVFNDEHIAPREAVRKGDAFIIETDACPVVVHRTAEQFVELGNACSFFGIDEAIDSVRCRLAFASLPSA